MSSRPRRRQQKNKTRAAGRCRCRAYNANANADARIVLAPCPRRVPCSMPGSPHFSADVCPAITARPSLRAGCGCKMHKQGPAARAPPAMWRRRRAGSCCPCTPLCLRQGLRHWPAESVCDAGSAAIREARPACVHHSRTLVDLKHTHVVHAVHLGAAHAGEVILGHQG